MYGYAYVHIYKHIHSHGKIISDVTHKGNVHILANWLQIHLDKF